MEFNNLQLMAFGLPTGVISTAMGAAVYNAASYNSNYTGMTAGAIMVAVGLTTTFAAVYLPIRNVIKNKEITEIITPIEEKENLEDKL